MNRFVYQARPDDNWKQRGEQTSGQYISFLKDNVETFQAAKDNWIRILPPTWQNPKHYGYDIWVHYGVGPQNASVICNLKMFNEQCPVCEAFLAADAQGNEDAYDLKSFRRVLVWLCNRKSDNPSQPEAWAMPWTLDRDISKLCKDKLTGELFQIDHPEAGYDVTFDREGDLPNVKYVGIQIARRPSPIGDARMMDSMLEYIVANPLPDLIARRTPEEVRQLFEGQSASQDRKTVVTMPQPQPQAQPPQQPQTLSREAMFGPPPPTNGGTPAAAPQQQADHHGPYCNMEVTFNGQTIACAQPAGHQGEHLFERLLGPQQPIPRVAVQFCPVEVTFQGRRIGCASPLNHPGEHLFERELSTSPSQPTPVPGAQEVGSVIPQAPAASAATASPSNLAPINSRAAALRERFMAGKK